MPLLGVVIHAASHQPSEVHRAGGCRLPMGQSRNASQRGTTWLSYVINVVSSCNWPQYTALCRQWGITNTGAVKLQASAYKESGIPLLFYISPCHEVTTSTPLFPFW